MKFAKWIGTFFVGILTLVVLLFWGMANGTGHRIPAASQWMFFLVFASLLLVFVILFRSGKK